MSSTDIPSSKWHSNISSLRPSLPSFPSVKESSAESQELRFSQCFAALPEI
jgi:hypothetical protein